MAGAEHERWIQKPKFLRIGLWDISNAVEAKMVGA
jgi:hypothetical protein